MRLLVSKPDGPEVEWDALDELLSSILDTYGPMFNPISQIDGSHLIWYRVVDQLFRYA